MLNSCRGLKGIGRNVQWCASHPASPREAATALPAPRRQSSWVLTVITDRPRRQASGFRWWIRKSGLHQKCSSPAELRCIQLPTWGYSIHHLHNVTVGDKAQSQHKQNLIKSLAKETVNEAATTKKAHNCLRIDIMPDTWGQSFCPVMEELEWPDTQSLQA